MVCVPRGTLVVLIVAMPELLRVPVPNELEPRTKLTVPAGIAPETEVTFAVKVTDFPTDEGFADDDRVVLVAAGPMVWFRFTELPAKLALVL